MTLRGVTIGAVVAGSTLAGAAGGQAVDEDLVLRAEDEAGGDSFGFSVAFADGLVVVGAASDDDNGENSGAVYFFDAETGQQVSKLTPEDGEANDCFGYRVAVDQGVLAVIASGDEEPGFEGGSVYLFDVETGKQLHKIMAPEEGSTWSWSSLALRDGLVVVGSPRDHEVDAAAGAAYVFDAHTGEQLFKLMAENGRNIEHAGAAVAIGGGVIAVGAPGTACVPFCVSGAVHLFDAATGQQLDTLLPEDQHYEDKFGAALAMVDGVLICGAPRDNPDGTSSGAVYMFDVETREQIREVTPNDARESLKFGAVIAASDDGFVVGVPNPATPPGGIVYAFDASGESLGTLRGSDTDWPDAFGWSLAWSGSRICVGAPSGGLDGIGSAYLFTAPQGGDDCPADWDGNGIVNAADVGAFLSTYFLDQLNGTTDADFNGDGVTNAADVGAFLSAYFPAQGACP